MTLTIIETGLIPDPIAADFPAYPDMIAAMFARAGVPLETLTVSVVNGDPLPDPEGIEAILITGSVAGVYDDFAWMDPLRDFVRAAHAARIKMVGICFGHQIIADALGGDVRKADKGWGLGRHTYAVTNQPGLFELPRASISIACSHQDQVIVPPAGAKVILSSEFTPNAGLVYDNGTTLTVQPHPEFEDGYMAALAEMRRGRIDVALVDEALASLATPSDSPLLVRAIAEFIGR